MFKSATHPKHIFWVILLLTHLVLVTCGANSLDVFQLPHIGKALTLYGAASGASDGYGFFAPGIFGQLRAYFEVTDAQGKKNTVSLESYSTHEANIRVAGIVNQFAREQDSPQEFGRSLAASLARNIFAQNKNAKLVTVHLDQFTPVSMEEYRAGKQGAWDSIYEATFKKSRGKL